ncbi:MAG: type II toxin-antitoxin system Phd/YefM family antitoxin [Dehalococcoidia bacterium]|nr:MAG: type II toxin-antitoxin system Phd/YefM family antitoxin [Dehalococcoidia bacterium]
MNMINVTDIRIRIHNVLSDLAKNGEPIIIVQRSKPVAYIVSPEYFMKMQKPEEDTLSKSRARSMEKIRQLREKIARRTGVQEDSTQLIRELREGVGRYE